MPPAKGGVKTGEVGVGSDPFASTLNCQRGMSSVSYVLAPDSAFFTETAKDLPVPRPRPELTAAGPLQQSVHEPQGIRVRGGRIEDPTVGDNPEKAVENGLRKSERLGTSGKRFQPFGITGMVRTFFAVRVDQDIDIRHLHG